MAREKEAYRDTLEDILRFFDGRRMLTITDVSTYTGMTRRTAKSRFGIDKSGISAIELAREMCR